MPPVITTAQLINCACSSAGAGGNALHSVWVAGHQVISGKLVVSEKSLLSLPGSSAARVCADGVPTTVNLDSLRAELQQQQPEYTDPETTDPTGTAGEVSTTFAILDSERVSALWCNACMVWLQTEYRAALGLAGDECIPQHDKATYAGYPQFRVNYPADIAK